MNDYTVRNRKINALIAMAIALPFVILFLVRFTPIGVVHNGEEGLFVRFGKIKGQSISEGLYFYEPIGTELVKYNIKAKCLTVDSEQYTKDIQQANVKMAITYCVDRSKVAELHRQTGGQFESTLINPAILGCTKDVMGRWEATEFVSHRNEAVALMSESLSKSLNDYGIKIVLVEMLDIQFSDQFEKSVEDKQVAEQEAIKEKNNTRRVSEVAQQNVIRAEAEAKAILLKAEAEAKAIEAKAMALEANSRIIEYERINKWNGVLPTHQFGNGVNPVAIVE